MGARGGAGPLGDQSLLRKVRWSCQSLERDEVSARSTSKQTCFSFYRVEKEKAQAAEQAKVIGLALFNIFMTLASL